MPEDLVSFIKAVGKHWLVLLTGGVIAAIEGALEHSTGTTLPGWAYWTVALFALFAACFLAWRDEHRGRGRAESRLVPVFEFSDTHPACYQIGDNADGPHQMARIVITNAGGSTVDGVRVSLTRLRPDPPGFGATMPLPLLPQHMPLAAPEYTITLAPNESRPIDVFGVYQQSPGQFRIFHAVRWAGHAIPHDDYRADIQAVGNNVPAVTQVVRLWVDGENRPRASLLS